MEQGVNYTSVKTMTQSTNNSPLKLLENKGLNYVTSTVTLLKVSLREMSLN